MFKDESIAPAPKPYGIANKNERINTQGDVSFRESAIVDEVNSIKVQNQNLINELEKIKKELNAKEEEVIISNNNLIYAKKAIRMKITPLIDNFCLNVNLAN